MNKTAHLQLYTSMQDFVSVWAISLMEVSDGDTCISALIFVLFSALFRNMQFFGLEAQQKITASYVVVIGLGGVGSHAASMLLRSGVGRLLLVDFDQVLSLRAI